MAPNIHTLRLTEAERHLKHTHQWLKSSQYFLPGGSRSAPPRVGEAAEGALRKGALQSLPSPPFRCRGEKPKLTCRTPTQPYTFKTMADNLQEGDAPNIAFSRLLPERLLNVRPRGPRPRPGRGPEAAVGCPTVTACTAAEAQRRGGTRGRRVNTGPATSTPGS